MAFVGYGSGSLSSYRSSGGFAVHPPVRCTATAPRDRFIAPRSATTAATAAMKEALFPNNLPLVIDCEDPTQYRIPPKKKQASDYEELLCLSLFNLTISQAAKKQIIPVRKEASLPVVPFFQYLKPQPTRRPVYLAPVMALDAPGMTGDFYRSPLAWSPQNLMAVQLDQVYVKNMGSETAPVQPLPMDPEQPTSCSVHWLQGGTQLVAANPNGSLELYDAGLKKIGTYSGTALEAHVRPECNAFENLNAHTLLLGNRSGALTVLDTRMQKATLFRKGAMITRIAHSEGHTLAIGANNNSVTLLDLRKAKDVVVYAHEAAVKALAWAPWDSSKLITGAGTADRSIRLFDVQRNVLLDRVETGSQVCTLFASASYRELVSTHGYNSNDIKLWKYRNKPNRAGHYLEACETISQAHHTRVVHGQMSPDGTTLATSAENESLKLWPLFTSTPMKSMEPQKPRAKALTIAHSTIR